VIKIAHQCRTGLAACHVARRAAHVDVDNLSSGGFGNPRALRHPTDLAACELNDVRTYSGGLAAQPRHRTTIDEIIAGGHFGNNQAGTECRRQASKRRIGDARHRRQENPVGDLNITYFQRLRV
jgi:hypothetical protein